VNKKSSRLPRSLSASPGIQTLKMTTRVSFKDIPPVPTSQEFLDIVLSGTQRRLPTQIRSGFKISRIRAFYTRKVKFTQEAFSEKLAKILDSFPRLTSCHPFHRDLFNCLCKGEPDIIQTIVLLVLTL
jgi:GTP1/Obg family GTP-binding protein